MRKTSYSALTDQLEQRGVILLRVRKRVVPKTQYLMKRFSMPTGVINNWLLP